MRLRSILLLGLLLTPLVVLAQEVDFGKEMAIFLVGWEEKETVSVPVDAFDPRKGADDPKVTVMVFSDFQCRPYCARAAQMVEELHGRYAAQVRFVFKHYPLNGDCNPSTTTRMHTEACNAALAAQCAGEQGRFWDFHDALFEAELAEGLYAPLAAELGLDTGRWQRCFEGQTARDQVATHARQGGAIGVSGTPNWVINGRTGGGMSRSRVETVIRSELRRHGAWLPEPLDERLPR